jgi:hypothetical protein
MISIWFIKGDGNLPAAVNWQKISLRHLLENMKSKLSYSCDKKWFLATN